MSFLENKLHQMGALSFFVSLAADRGVTLQEYVEQFCQSLGYVPSPTNTKSWDELSDEDKAMMQRVWDEQHRLALEDNDAFCELMGEAARICPLTTEEARELCQDF